MEIFLDQDFFIKPGFILFRFQATGIKDILFTIPRYCGQDGQTLLLTGKYIKLEVLVEPKFIPVLPFPSAVFLSHQLPDLPIILETAGIYGCRKMQAAV